MLFVILLHANSLNPVIFVPGTMRSRLYMNSTRKPYWYCKHSTNSLAWLNLLTFIPPFMNCFFDSFGLDYDPIQGIPKNKPNATIRTIDGLNGIGALKTSVFGLTLEGYFKKMVKEMIKRGNSDFHGAPYDWRFGLSQSSDYFINLKATIENAYLNTNKSSNIVCHSLGCMIVHRFLSNETSPIWRGKYVKKVIMIAPSFSGSGLAFITLWRQYLPYAPFLATKDLKEFIGSLGALHVHIPNAAYYSNTTIMITPDGSSHTPEDIPELLNDYGKLSHSQQLLADVNIQYTTKVHSPLDVETNIIYNSGIDTPIGLDIRNNPNGKVLYDKGDGLVGSKGVEIICSTWKKNLTRCINVNASKTRFIHRNMVGAKEVISQVLEWV